MLKEHRLRRGIRLFDNPVLDWLSRVHPALPGLFWGPAAIAMIIWAVLEGGVAWWHPLLLVPAGVVVWWFAEYAIHRFFFHFQPQVPWMKQLFYYVHEHHHRYQEWDRLLAPPLMSGPIFIAFLGLFYLVIGLPAGVGAMWLVTAGFVFGYLGYDYTHFYTHFAKPKSKLGKFLRRCHMQHHFARPDRWYGISCPWIDYVFSTHLHKGEKSQNNKQNRDGDHHYFGDDELPPKVQAYERQLAEEGKATPNQNVGDGPDAADEVLAETGTSAGN